MRFTLAVLVAGLLAIPAGAQTWYARGDFNGFGLDHPMVDSGDGVYFTRTIDGLFSDASYNFKVGTEDWTASAPSNDARVRSDALGAIELHFWDQTTWDDGWSPNDRRRVGYVDANTLDWEIVGSFNGWPGDAHDPNYYLTDQGNGLHTGSFPFNAGLYEFKFRAIGANPENVWDTTIGNGDFSNSGANNGFAVLTDGDLWNFELDLPNGRWRAYTEAAPPPRPGDYNGDDMVDAADYVVWRKNDPDNQAGYDEWRANFGAGAGPQPWYVRGEFNGFGLDHQMVDQGGGHYTATVTGLNPGEGYDYKVARADWTEFEPVLNGITFADASGNINFHFYDDTDPNDGWLPNKRRVGYEDHGQFDWELMGEVNDPDWTGGEQWFLTDMGNGLHRLEDVFLTAGTYQLKFRQQGNWDVNIGLDFGNHASNGVVTLTEGLWAFELDLPGGRWRAVADTAGAGSAAVPEPASLALVALGALLMLGVRRK